jgi:uncharacterized protein
MDLRHPVAWLREQGKKVLEIQDSPHAIALGIAIGIFWGFTPMYGLKTVLTLLSAMSLRANKIAAVVAVSLHDLLFPIFPAVFEIEYLLGKKVLELFGVTVHAEHLHGLHLKELMNWTTFVNLGEPMLIGTFLFGLLTSPLFYLVARGVVEAAHRRRATK